MDVVTIVALASALGAGALVDRILTKILGRKAAQVELAAAAVQVANEVLGQVRIELEKCERKLVETQAALEFAQQEITALRSELAEYRRENAVDG